MNPDNPTFRTDAEKKRAQEYVKIVAALKYEAVLKIIQEWKYFWMNQSQNSEEDFKNYFDRAFGIDSNMMHHLAKLISESAK